MVPVIIVVPIVPPVGMLPIAIVMGSMVVMSVLTMPSFVAIVRVPIGCCTVAMAAIKSAVET